MRDKVIGCKIHQTSYPVETNDGDGANGFKMRKEKQLRISDEFFERSGIINSIDFTIKANKLVSGSKNGLLKVLNITMILNFSKYIN